MFKIFSRLKWQEWLLICVLAGFVVCQVYFDIELATYTKTIMNEMIDPLSTTKSILGVGGIMLLYALGSMACTMVVGFIAAKVSTKLSFRLRRELYKKVQNFSLNEIDKFTTAGLITRTTNDIQQTQMATIMLMRVAVSAPVTAIWAILKIQSTSLQLTLATAGWIIIMVATLGVIFALVFPKFKRIQKLTDRLNAVTRENLTGLRVVRAYNAEAYQEEKFDEVNEDLTRVNLFTGRTTGLMFPMLMFVMNCVTLTIYWLGAHIIETGNGVLNFTDLTSFANLSMQVLSSFMMLTMLFIMVPRASVSAKRINEVLDTKNSIEDLEQTMPLNCEKGGQIEFKGVSFKYFGADGYVLNNINFKVDSGQTLAIIGSTGSGKTTLINLIPRLFDATEGEVLVNGQNVKSLPQKELRSIIGYVPQKSLLFSGNIADNVCFGGDIDENTMLEACRVACAKDFIESNESGYHYNISQGGKNVSGGQRQRLSIARAVAIKPQILIFDDSFSALDYKTDRQVRTNLANYCTNTTKVIVAQRIGTIIDADNIIVLDKGNIVGMGRHDALLHDCPVYRDIALSQLSKEELGL